MNKKLITALLAITLTTSTISVSKAEDAKPQTVAILDTALDTNLPIFKDRLIHEVCILAWNSCPNKQSFMEGAGASLLPLNILSKNGFDHGTQMASVLVQENPDIKFVFIRIIGNTVSGDRQTTPESTVVKALDWVYSNKDKFNIQAVTMSQGNHNLLNAKDYCPKTVSTQSRIKQLLASGVPTFLPAGNIKDYKRIDWPACLPESIAIGASSREEEIATFSNYDPLLIDFYALGYKTASVPGGKIVNAAGTSVAVQVAAAKWLKVKSSKPDADLYSLIKKTGVNIKGINGMIGNMINIEGALNG